MNLINSRCKRTFSIKCYGTECAEQLKEPLVYSYNFMTFPSSAPIPSNGYLDIFTIRGSRIAITTVDFHLTFINATAPRGVEMANENYFQIRPTNLNEAMLSVVKSIRGPQDIQLKLDMKTYHRGFYGGTARTLIYIHVSEYEY